MFDENNAKQLILRILQLPIPEQYNDDSIRLVNLFFQKKKIVKSKKAFKSLELISPFNTFMLEVFGDGVLKGTCFYPWTNLFYIDTQMKTSNLSENDLKACSLFVFYAALDWLTIFEYKNIEDNEPKNNEFSFLPDSSLLDTMLTVASTYNAFEHLSLSLFCLIFTRVAYLQPIASTDYLISSANKFISTINSRDSQTLHLVDWALLINSKYTSVSAKSNYNVIPQPLRTVLELIMQAVQLMPGYFSRQDAMKIFLVLEPFAVASCSCRDPFPLNLAVVLAPFLEVEEIDKLFSLGVSELVSFIASNPPFISFRDLFFEESGNGNGNEYPVANLDEQKEIEITEEESEQEYELSNENEQHEIAMEESELKQPAANENENMEEQTESNENKYENPALKQAQNEIQQPSANENESESSILQPPTNESENNIQQPPANENQNKNDIIQPLANEIENENSIFQPSANENIILQPLINENKNENSILQPSTNENGNKSMIFQPTANGDTHKSQHPNKSSPTSKRKQLLWPMKMPATNPDDCIDDFLLINSKRLFIERGPPQEAPFIVNYSEFSSQQNLLSLIPNDVKSVASLLKHTLSYSSHTGCELFPSQIENFLDWPDSLFSVLIVLFFMCENSNFEESSLCEFFRFVLRKTPLFSASHSVFTNSGRIESLQMFLSLRFYAVRIFIEPAQVSCFQLYWNTVSLDFLAGRCGQKETALFAEFFAFMGFLDYSDLLSSVLPICISDTYFATLNEDDNSLVCSCISSLIESVLRQVGSCKELLSNFFVNEPFLDFISVALFDSYFSESVLYIETICMQRFADKLASRLSTSFVALENVHQLELIINNQAQATHHIHVLSKLFEMIIELITKHPEKSVLFTKLFQSSYTSMRNLASLSLKEAEENNEVTAELKISLCELLHNFIKFAALASFDPNDDLSWTGRKASKKAMQSAAFRMEKPILDSIFTMIRSLEGDEPSTPCFSTLMFASSGGKSSSLRAEFLISRPSFIRLTLRAFSLSSRLNGFLKFVSSLCEFSAANRRACHIGRVDHELIQIVRAKTSSCTVIKDALHLFMQIAQTACSTSVVASFIGCFHCFQEAYRLSPIIAPALETLDAMLVSGRHTPAASLPAMNELPFIRVEGLTESDISGGFTVISWVFIDGGSQDSPAPIASVSLDGEEGQKRALLTIFVQLGRVFVGNSRILGGRDAVVLEDVVPTDRWTMIAVTFEPSGRSTKLEASSEFVIKSFINNKSSVSRTKIPIGFGSTHNRSIVVTSCGSIEGGSDLEHPALIASVAFFPMLKPHTCLEIVQNELLLTQSNTERNYAALEVVNKLPPPLFCAIIESENSVLTVSNGTLKKPKTSKVTLEGKAVVQQMPFAAVFARFFTTNSILPVLALLSLKSPSTQLENQNESRNEALASCALRALFHAIQMSPQTSCREFVASGGFRIISFLLSSLPDCLTPGLFNQAVALARETSNEEIRNSTADEIIFNEKLWSLAAFETKKYVVQQWIALAFEKKESIQNHPVSQTRRLADYIAPTLLLYWKKVAADSETDLQLLITNSIVVRSGSVLSQSDVSALIGAALCKDVHVSDDALFIMQQVAMMPDSFSSFSDSDFLALHELLNRGSGSLVCALMRFVVAIHSPQRRCLFTLAEHSLVIANAITSSTHFTHQDVMQLSDLSDAYSEIFPVYCAASAFEGRLETVFTSPQPINRKQTIQNDWAVWPVITSLHFGGKSLSSAVKCMLKRSADFVELFAQTAVASTTVNDRSGSACRELLLQIGASNLVNRLNDTSTSPKKSEDSYISLCFYFIFFCGTNDAFLMMMRNEGEESRIVDKNFLKSEVTIELRQPPFSSFNAPSSEKPGFRIDEEGSWIDKELALQCVQVIVKRKLTMYSNLALFLLTYLIKILPGPSLTLLHEFVTFASFDAVFGSIFMAARNPQSSTPVDQTAAFEMLVEQFKQPVTFIQSAADSCARRMNSLVSRYLLARKKERGDVCKLDLKATEQTMLEEKRASRRLWRELWRKMTFDCAPWHSALTCAPGWVEPPRRWKRDETLCTCSFVPMKMKVNYKFDDHNEASLGRELGNLKLARQQNEETKRKARLTNPCPDLLETCSFSDNETNEAETNEANNNNNSNIDLNNQQKIRRSSSKRKSSLSYGFGFDSATRIRFSGKQNSKEPVFTCECQRVTVTHTRNCVFILTPDKITLTFRRKTKEVPIRDIARVFLRAPLHHQTGIEIITRQGTSFFVTFPEFVRSREVAESIAELAPPNIRPLIQTQQSSDFLASHGLTTLWRLRRLSNFEYLMLLNYYSGRSFSMLSMYPFLPWVLVDYESENIDIHDDSKFRDMSIPVGKFGEKRLESLRNRSFEMMEFGDTPFLYSSYAVSPLTVILWMMREEPFTTLHIEMQSGKFDHAARQFSSISDTFRMVNTHLNDFRELIPEFFFSEEFLVNENSFDLGTANQIKIDSVRLPSWAHGDALTFVYYNRKALESEHVSMHLNEWIDLVWGCKQRGKAAFEADNTYDPNIYSDVWNEEALNDPGRRSLINETLTHCGQIPDQLFTSPHPPRESLKRNEVMDEVTLALVDSIPLQEDQVMFGTIRQIEDKVELVLLTSSGKFFGVIIVKEEEKGATIDDVFPLMKGASLKLDESTTFAMFSIDEIAVGTASGKVSVVDTKRITVCNLQPHEGTVNCVAASAPYVVSGGADTVIACMEKETSQNNSNDVFLSRIFSMPAYSSEVVCAAVSKEFHAVASGTRGGLVIVQSLERSSVTCVVDLEGARPLHISITRGWGFLVVCAEKSDGEKFELQVYTLRGVLIGSRDVEAGVSRILTWTSDDGFDFVIAALNSGTIVAFEAFYVKHDLIVVADCQYEGKGMCKLPDGFGEKSDEIVVMNYSSESRTLVCISKSGRVVLINNFSFDTDRIM